MLTEFLNPLIAIISGLGGVYLGGWLTNRREVEKRRSDFANRQLSEFYGPLLSIRIEINARSKLRMKIDGAANSAWGAMIDDARKINVEAVQQIRAERWPAFSAIIDDDNKTLRDILLPAYRQMLATFRERMWLAEPDTRQYFMNLVEFIDIWDRHIRDAMPGEVIEFLDHGERNLSSFYAHLEETHDRLRRELAAR